MLICKCKFLEARELPEKPPYPPSYLVSILSERDTRNYIATREAYERLEHLEPLSDLIVVLSDKLIRLEQFGGSGKGNAYRHQIVGVLADLGEVG